MSQSIDVNLPKAHVARFPDRCVICGCDHPSSHVRIITGSIGWWTWLLWWYGRPFIVKAPSCRRCAWTLHGRRALSFVVSVTIMAAALWFIWPYFKDSVPRGLRKWAMLAIALVCVLPQLILEVLFAQPFGVTAYADNVDYEFTSDVYAVQFAVLNNDAAWVKLNGIFMPPPPSADDDV